MKNELQMVADFHEKFGFPIAKNLCDENADTFPRGFGVGLLYMAEGLIPLATKYGDRHDERMRRAQLMCEELAETLIALDNRDPFELADALTDLLYVVLGTAITYGIPVDKCFEEVQRSNMSKTRLPGDPRMKTKDPALGYFAPDLKRVLTDHMDGALRRRAPNAERWVSSCCERLPVPDTTDRARRTGVCSRCKENSTFFWEE